MAKTEPTKNNPTNSSTRTPKSFIYNNQVAATQRMLDFDYAAGRNDPLRRGNNQPNRHRQLRQSSSSAPSEILIPVYKTIEKAAQMHPNVDVMINFASFRSAASSTEEALAIPQIRTIVIIAEGVPERRMPSAHRQS